LFSHRHLLLLHVHSHLSAQSTCTLLCPSSWSSLNLVKTKDIIKVSNMPDINGEEEEFKDDWNCISDVTDQ
ncbi:uncharacterized protein BJ212DRAFT_1257342, partial [Suillus subaureus]